MERSEERNLTLNSESARARADLQLLTTQPLAGNAIGLQLQQVDELKSRLAKYDQLRDALFGAEDEVWQLRAANPPDDYERRMRESRTRIITVASYKGGVGKTTITANLAAYFALRRAKRVLLIDFDYQGSLTRTMILGARLPQTDTILADAIIKGEADGRWVATASRELNSILPYARLITCGQTFDGIENRSFLRWLLGETADDVRFRLSNILLSQPVQESFDIVIIDAPPRASTGAINAYLASHAIIVPTVLDLLSVETVSSFLARMSTFRKLNPVLEQVGVVANLTEQTRLRPSESEALEKAKLALARWQGKSHVFHNTIRHFAALSQAAGRDIGYIRNGQVRAAFDALGEEVVSELRIS